MQTLGAVSCPLLIGRDDLLDLVDRRLDEVVAGRGQFLLLAGEAGIGKTRFLDAISQKARERGFAISGGAVAPQDRDVPAASILDMARTMIRVPRFAELGRDLLDLRDQTIDAEQVRRRQLVMDVVDRILAAVTGPTMLTFEDLQWADELSLEIIGEVARRSRDRTLLITGGYRTDEALPGTSLRDWRSRLLTQRITEELRLTPLSHDDTAMVTTLILDSGLPAPREVVDAVFERTDGVPLHIEELLGALSAEARANGLAIREATVPDTIEDAVLSRLGHLSSEAQDVARAGAVIGRCFVPDVLAGIMDVPAETLDAPLQELVDNFVLEPPGLRGLFDFRHQLLRDAIYATVPLGNRRRLHARAGEFGTQLEGGSEIHASVHYERAGLRRLAFEAAVAGARDAVRLAAHREAFELYRRAVDNVPDDLPDGDRSVLFEAFAEEASAIEENELAARMYEVAQEASRRVGDAPRVVRLTSGILTIWRREGRSIRERRTLIDATLAEIATFAAGSATDALRAWLLIDLAICQLDAQEVEDARTTIREYGDFYRGTEDVDSKSEAESRSAMLDILDGDVDGGLTRIAEAAVSAQDAGADAVGVTAYRNAATWALRTLRYDRARDYLDEGLRYADSIEQSHCAHVMQASSAMVAWAGADWVESMSLARQALADHGCRRAAEMARWSLGYVALGKGDLVRAETELRRGIAFGETAESLELILPPMWGLAETALLAGQPDRAAALCRDALERAIALRERSLLVPFVVTGVRAEQAAGRPSAAEAWLAACAAQLSGTDPVAATALEHGRGLVALASGATGLARNALEAAIRGWDGVGRIWESSWARLDLAACLIRSNRYADAVALAVEVRTIASRLDSQPLADWADAVQRQARGRVVVDEPWRPLTAREFAVARLVSEGYTNAEIADSLGIAPKTASSHVEHILAKLGASRRAEIASWASNVERSPVAR